MALRQNANDRALDNDERELVERSRHPGLQKLSDKELRHLVKLMRERRDKAKATSNHQRRELRGKASPRGETPVSGNEGSRHKVALLSTAMRRLNGESERRRRMSSRTALVASAQKALDMKRAHQSDGEGEGFNSRTAHEGMRKITNHRVDSLINPRERGRLRKSGAIAQVRRDGH